MSLEGDIGEVDVIGRLVELGREQFTGAIRYENDGIIKIIYFKGGDILSASTNDRSDSIDEILLRGGKVTREHVKQALAKRKESETLGDALLNLGFITRKELSWARRVQVIGIVRSIGGWTAGQYTIVADYLPKREEGTLFPLAQIIVEIVVTEQDRAKFERALDGGNAIFRKAPDFSSSFQRLGLNQDAEEIVAQVDGRKMAAEIAAASGKDDFNVYKLLHALTMLGILQRVDQPAFGAKPQGSDELPFGDMDDFSKVGVSDAADLWSDPAPAPAAPLMAPTIEMPVGYDEPTQAIAMPAWNAAEPSHAPAASAWDDESPSWDAPASAPTLAIGPLPPEPQWGFDEAQIETARRAAVPLSGDEPSDHQPMKEIVAEAAKPNRYVGALLGGVLIVILGVGGFMGWNWWQGRELLSYKVGSPKPAPAPAPAPHPKTTTVATTTVATATTTAPVATTSSVAAATTTMPIATATTAPAKPLTVAVPAPPAQTATTLATKPTPTVIAAKTPPAATTTSPRLERRSDGGAMITNTAGLSTKPLPAPAPKPTPVASTANDPVKARYDDMARQNMQSASGNFTIQFELVCQTASLTKAMQAGGAKVWFVPTQYRGGSCYRVFWGHYDAKDEAAKAIAEVPASLRGGALPVVVRIPRS